MILYTPNLFLEGFSISHVAIIDPYDPTPEMRDGDLYGVRSASIEANVDSVDEFSNDVAIGMWNSVSTLDISVTSGYVSLDFLARLNGSSPPTGGLVPETVEQRHEYLPVRSLNHQFVSMLFRVPAKDKNGYPMYLDFVLYRVKLAPVSFGEMSYKEGLEVSYSGKAFLSRVDETGQDLDRPAFGYLLAAGNGPFYNTYVPDNVRYDDPMALYGG